jgi:hypothetical protein
MALTNTIEDRRDSVDDAITEVIRHCLQGKCIELSIFLYHGTLPPLLLEEVAEIASDAWALRERDDT